MRDDISSDDRAVNLAERYVSDGYVVVEDLVGQSDLEAIGDDAMRFARGDYRIINPSSLRVDLGEDDASAGILAVHFPHWVSDVARRLIAHNGIREVLERITGAHLPFWDGRVKCMQSMLFMKPPGLQGQAWHQDERFIPTRDRSLVGAWIAVDDATADNGCLRVLPGSHRTGFLWPTHDHHASEEFDPTDEAYGFDGSGEVIVDVPAGSVVFFNGYLLHRSLRNRSDRSRRALVNHYCNAWSPLPWVVPPRDVSSLEIATLDNRAVVVLGDDPYASRGVEATPDWVFVRPHHG